MGDKALKPENLVLTPVPPLAIATIPLTFVAFPKIFPVTLLPATASILASVTATLAISSVAMVPFNILVEVMAPVAIAGKSAVPARSPAS